MARRKSAPLMAGAVLVLAACGGTASHQSTTAVAATAGAASPEMHPSTPASTAAPSGPPLNLRGINWPNATVPGAFCYAPDSVQLTGENGSTSSSRWGQVKFVEEPPVIYGNLGNGTGEVAAVHVECNVGVPTAAAVRADAYIIFTGAGGRLTPVGTITPQQTVGASTTRMAGLAIAPGIITVHEAWYRETDPTCCPSGRATTIWSSAHGTLTPSKPDITA